MNDVEVVEPRYAEGSSNLLSVTGNLDPAYSETVLRMEDGQTLRLTTSALLQAMASSDASSYEPSNRGLDDKEQIVIPLVEERLQVGKRKVATGTVRLHRATQEFTQTLDETLAVRTFDVERVVLNQPVESAPPTRQEGNVTIYSLVEEQLVLTRQLILREEVRITQRDTERRDTRAVTLHKEHMTVERE